MPNDDIVGYDGVYMPKMSAAGKKAWVTRKNKKSIQEIRIELASVTDCYLIDNRIEALNELKEYVHPELNNKIHLIEGDYKDKIIDIMDKSPGCLGLIYFDPNGIVDLDFIMKLSKHRSMSLIDLLFNYNATAFKRKAQMMKSGMHFNNYFRLIEKRSWYISRPNGKWQWSFLFGTNTTKLKLPTSYGFHNVLSDEGKYILNKLNYTKEEYKECKFYLRNQPTLEDCFRGQ